MVSSKLLYVENNKKNPSKVSGIALGLRNTDGYFNLRVKLPN